MHALYVCDFLPLVSLVFAIMASNVIMCIVSSSIILDESSDLQGPRSTVIALIMIVSICLMIFFIVCFTLLFYLLKRND